MGTGVDTDKKDVFRTAITDVERKQIEYVKKHYKMSSDRELLLALVKREALRIS